jgi:hypothetical protein
MCSAKVVAPDIRYSASCCHMTTLQFVHATCSCLSQSPRILQSYRNINSAVFSRLLRGPTPRCFVYGLRLAMALPWRKARNLSAWVPAWISPCWIYGWRSGWHWSRLLSEKFVFFFRMYPSANIRLYSYSWLSDKRRILGHFNNYSTVSES